MVDRNAPTATLRTWYLSRSAVAVLAVTVSGALAGGGLLHLATRLSNPMLGLAGVVLATICAWVTTDYTSTRWRDPTDRRWRTFVIGSALAGAVLVVVSDLGSWPFPAFVGLMALTIGLGPIVGEGRDAAAERAERWMGCGLLLSLFGAVATALRWGPTWPRVAGAALVLAGFGFFTGGLSAHCTSGGLPHSPVLRLLPGDAAHRGLLAGAVGIVMLVVGVVSDVALIAVVAAWLIVVAMVVLSVKPLRFELSTTMQWTVLGSGVGLVAIAGYQLSTTDTVGRSGWFIVFIVVTVALAGAWIVWRGATLFIAVLVGFVFVWGLFSNTTVDPHDVSSERADGDVATSGVVAIGDSFISGEGARRFFDGTDQKGRDRNECRRAPTAYPALVSLGDDGRPLASDLDPIEGLTHPGLDFYACSGATIAQVVGPSSAVGDPTPAAGRSSTCSPKPGVVPGQYPCGPDGVYGSRLQLDDRPPVAGAGDTQLVLVSIGGNDVRFGDIVAGCLLPGSCADRREIWLDNVAALGPELTAAYAAIRTAFDPDDQGDVAIVVMPYPSVLTERSCAGSPFDSSEHAFIDEFTTVLDQQIATSARQAGVHYFADGQFAFAGHRVCDGASRAVNLIALQPTDGPLLDRMSPGSWTHDSMHPNRLGHQLTARALTRWLNADHVLERGNPEPDLSARTELLGVRTARPLAVSPSTLSALDAAPVDGCDFAGLTTFATRIAVFDEQSGVSGDDRPFKVPVDGADPESVVCVTDSNGAWVALAPDTGADALSAPAQRPTATVQDGRVFVTGGRPRPGCPSIDAPCAYQWVLYASPLAVDATTGVDEPAQRQWSLRAVRYCSTDPDCANTFAEWSSAQIASATRKVAPPAAMIFLGGWLLALGWNLLQGVLVPVRIRRWIDRVAAREGG